MMKQELNAYVPAIEFTDEKELTPLRSHREELSVIDPANGYRILAHRPYCDLEGKTLPSLWSIQDSELSFLQAALSFHNRVALFADGHAVLILGELYDASGVLLAVRPHVSPAALRRYAETCWLGEIAFSPAFPAPAATLSDEELEAMDELNYYLRLLSTPHGRVSVATLVWRVANFVGCRLEHTETSTKEGDLPKTQAKRLTAYLLCVFLHLHTLNGSVYTTDATDADRPRFHCRIAYVDPTAEPSAKALLQLAELPFHALPAFSDFVLRMQEDRLIMDAQLTLSSDKEALRAAIPALFVLRLILERL